MNQRGMDLLDHLADVEVPPMPVTPAFTHGVRRKLHPRLLAAHVAEFAVGATAWAAWYMLVALVAAVVFSLTGAWPRGPRRTEGECNG